MIGELRVGDGADAGVLLDPAVGVAPASLAASWDDDEQARALGSARVEAAAGQEFVPGALVFAYAGEVALSVILTRPSSP